MDYREISGLDGFAQEQAYPVEISPALQQLAASLDRQPH